MAEGPYGLQLDFPRIAAFFRAAPLERRRATALALLTAAAEQSTERETALAAIEPLRSGTWKDEARAAELKLLAERFDTAWLGGFEGYLSLQDAPREVYDRGVPHYQAYLLFGGLAAAYSGSDRGLEESVVSAACALLLKKDREAVAREIIRRVSTP